MIINIPSVDSSNLQTALDEQFGAGVFTSGMIKSVTPFQCYIEYVDSTPQSQVDLALDIANQQSLELLKSVQIRLYQSLAIVADKHIAMVVKPPFTDEEIQQANDWLFNQSLPVPTCVVYVSLSDSVSNQIAAEKIVNSRAKYDQLISQIKTIQQQGQAAILGETTVYNTKIVYSDYETQIYNVVNYLQ